MPITVTIMGEKVTIPDHSIFSSTALRRRLMEHPDPVDPWPFGSVLERPAAPRWDPTKVMVIATWDEHHIEVVYLNGPLAGLRERVNPLDWLLVPEDES